FDGLLERLDAEQLLDRRGTVFESLLGVVGNLDRDGLAALRQHAHRFHDDVDIVFADLLEVLEILDHCHPFPGPQKRRQCAELGFPACPGIRQLYTALHNKVKYYFAMRKGFKFWGIALVICKPCAPTVVIYGGAGAL